MKILSIEPTPSPNVMKINLDETLPDKVSYNFVLKDKEKAPKHIQALLSLEGVTGIYQVLDFIAIERHPKAKWEQVLADARTALGEYSSESLQQQAEKENDAFGEIKVYIQNLKQIPIQIKLVKNDEEIRCGLPPRFAEAIMQIQNSVTNLVYDREWIPQSSRYGQLQEVGAEIVAEVSAAYNEERLHKLVEQTLNPSAGANRKFTAQEVLAALDDPDWEVRYAAMDQFEPTLGDIAVLQKASKDPKASIRRLAVVYLSYIEDKAVLPHFYVAMQDSSAIVRRTAGDCLSDKGDPDAIPTMCLALKDKNKLVRWRAARFLYEVGDESAAQALAEATADPEFEVKMQAQIALERIKSGEAASGTVWQQMTERKKR